MTDPLTTPTCPDCGTALPTDSPQALCPACLMKQAFASRTIADADEKTAAPPLTPDEIADKFPGFEILECLGRGGMGVVYKARQKSLNRLVAIKILAPERVGDERFAERFTREARTLALLNHPNIVTVFDYGDTDGLFYILMEFVDGVNLRDLLRDGKLEPKQALAIVPPICEALQYAHDKGIVHRDIKPENLLLDRDGRVKIADFGIAGLVGAEGESAGTPPYMAPEQSGPEVDHRADIYALGVVLYEMLTGERPATPLDLPSRKVSLDIRIDDIVLRALSKEPERRYQCAGDFRTMIETVAEPRLGESSAPDSMVESPVVSQSGNKKRMLLVSVLLGLPLLLLVMVSVWNFFMSPRVIPSNDVGVIGRAAFQLDHPESTGGTGLEIPIRQSTGIRWYPNSGKSISLKDGTTLRVRVRAAVMDPVDSEAFVSCSENGLDWDTRSGPIGPGLHDLTFQFENGLKATVKWRSLSKSALNDGRKTPVVRFMDVRRNEAIGLLALALLVFISVWMARKRPGIFCRWWRMIPLMGFLHRRCPEPQQVARKEALPPDPESRFYGRLSFGLFLAGTLGTLLLMTLSPRHDMALIFGAIAMLVSLVLAGMSWREPLSKFVIVIVGAVFVVALIMALVFRMLGR